MKTGREGKRKEEKNDKGNEDRVMGLSYDRS